MFEFSNGIVVSSKFDSGNLTRCTQADDDPLYFTMYMNGDGMPYTHVGHYRTWWYFSIKGVKPGDTVTFAIRGMAQQGKLYKMGLRPVFRVLPKSKKWKRCNESLYWKTYEDGHFGITFTHTFNGFGPTDTAYFAWTYPWSF